MTDYLNVKRNHFRFPAYDDDAGVKLKQEKKKNFSQEDDWILTEIKDSGPAQREQPRALRRTAKSSQEKYGHSLRQKEELKQHKENLPNYSLRNRQEEKPTDKKELFGDNGRRSTYKVKSKSDTETASVKKEYSGRSYFVPKYIPASIIPDKENERQSSEELLQSMEKPKESYLTFDTAPAAYQVKNEDDPTVKKFQHTEAANMTRSQYRATSKQSNDKKRSVLERSLKGIIEESKTDLNQNGYFK